MGVAIMQREALATVSFLKNEPRTLHSFLHRCCSRTWLGLIHFHVLVSKAYRWLSGNKLKNLPCDFPKYKLFQVSQDSPSINRWLTKDWSYFDRARELLLQSEGSSLKEENSGNKFEVNSLSIDVFCKDLGLSKIETFYYIFVQSRDFTSLFE